MRHAARKDTNQGLIVTALRAAGATVAVLSDKDLPDLLVGYEGQTFLLEVKDGAKSPSRRRLRPGQERFFGQWKGGPLHKIETIADAFRVVGIVITALLPQRPA